MPVIQICTTIAFICTLFSCNNGIKYPDGGYAYPEHVDDKDTNFYYYPLKDKLSRKDSFQSADDYMLFKVYDEPNLSLKSQNKDVFRFLYSETLGGTIIINLTENEIVVKKHIGGNIFSYPSDESK